MQQRLFKKNQNFLLRAARISILEKTKMKHKKDYKEKNISKELEQIIENRETKQIKDENKIPLYKDDNNFYNGQIIMPIISISGDCIGSIVIVTKENENFQEGIEKILKVACSFLGKQVQ